MKTLSNYYPDINIPQLNGFTIDSRMVENGDCFLALKGENVDGNNYVEQAESKGASLIISQTDFELSIPSIKINAEKDILQSFAKNWRSEFELPIIGITGTNGKTTTKDLLNHVVTETINTMCTTGNFNSSIGMPISLFSLHQNDELCILEMGASEQNEIEYLCNIAQPTMGLITNIAEAHTKQFGTVDIIAETKSALFKCLPKNGIAFINMDDPFISEMQTDAIIISYGFKYESTFSGSINNNFLTVDNCKIEIPFGGKAMAQNALAAYSVSKSLGISSSDIKLKIESFSASSGRGEIVKINGVTIINDSYNANLASAISGIESLIQMQGERKIIVIGDMFELGELSQSHHQLLGEVINGSNIDAVFAIGNLTTDTIHTISNETIMKKHYQLKSILVNDLRSYLRENDIVYIKGSRGMKMEDIIKGLES